MILTLVCIANLERLYLSRYDQNHPSTGDYEDNENQKVVAIFTVAYRKLPLMVV
jgi:hypothetical protein